MINYSIIIPHFNSLDVLSRAIDSIPQRTDIEVLVIDNSPQPILADFIGDRTNIKLFFSPYGNGAGAARNVGLSHAFGKWLLMLDADDFFTPNAFNALDAFIDSESDIIFFRSTSCYSDSYQISDRHIDYNNCIDYYFTHNDETILRYAWASPCAKMISRKIVSTHNILFSETQAANDVMFSLLTGYYAENVSASNDVIYCATTRIGSLTQTPSLGNITDRIDIAIEFNSFLKSHNLPNKYLRSIMFYIYTVYKHYNLLAATKLLLHSIAKGNNPLIGITRWRDTIRRLKQNKQ